MLLQKIRDYVRGWFAYVIVGLLIIPFAVWGINYYFEGGGPTDVAVVDGSKITQQEFQQAYQQQRQRMQAMLGDNLDPALLEGGELKQQTLRQLVDEQVLNQTAHRQGLRVSDQQLHDAVVNLPIFQQSGGFSPELYQQLLRSQGYTAMGFEESLRRSLAAEQFRNGVAASALIMPHELDQWVALIKQQRELRYVALPFSQYLERATVTDAAVAEYYEKNRPSLMNPEQVRVQWIELKQQQVADGLTLSEEEIQAAYQEQIAKYTRPEERAASHILVRLPSNASAEAMAQARAKAGQIAEAIRSGTKTFDQAMQEAQADESGMEAGDLGLISKGMFKEAPALEDALFALAEVGAISEPVQMPSGFHVLRLDRINPGVVQPFTEVREAVAAELRHQRAENTFYDKSQTLANLGYEHPDNLKSAADALAVPIQESAWFGRQGGEGAAAYPKVVESAFSEDVLKRGVNSEPLEVEPGHLIMIRVQEHQDATPRTLEEARADIVKTLKEEKARQTSAEAAAQLKARAAGGEHLAGLAKELGGTFAQPGLVGRDAQGVNRAILAEAFRLPQPPDGQMALGMATLENGDQAVLAVTRVTPGAADALSKEERLTLSQQLAQQNGSEQFASLLDSLRAQAKIVLHNDRL